MATREMTAAAIIETLGLARHPEGGWYGETFRDANGGARGHSTAIYYLSNGRPVALAPGPRAAEVWHYYAGAPLALSIPSRAGPLRRPGSVPTCSAGKGRNRSCPRLVAIRHFAWGVDARRLHRRTRLRLRRLRDG